MEHRQLFAVLLLVTRRGWRCSTFIASLLYFVLFAAVPSGECWQTAFLLLPLGVFPFQKHGSQETPDVLPLSLFSAPCWRAMEPKESRKSLENWMFKTIQKIRQIRCCLWSRCLRQLCHKLSLHLRISLELRSELGRAPWHNHSSLTWVAA